MSRPSVKNGLKRTNTKRLLFESQFTLPDNFEAKVLYLEEVLNCGKFNKDNLNELVELYTVNK